MVVESTRKRRETGDWRPTFVGVMMAFMMLLQLLGEGAGVFIEASSAMALIVLGLVTLSYPRTNSLPVLFLILMGAFFLLLIWSAVLASGSLGTGVFQRVIAVIMFLSLGIIFAMRSDQEILEKALPIYSFSLVFVLIWVLIDNDRLFARLSGHLHPNLWGFVVSASAVGLLFVPIHWAFRAFAIAFVLYLLAFEFQTRGALIWSTFGIVSFGSLLVYKKMTSGRQNWLGFAVFFNLVAAVLILFFFSFEWIFFDVLQANSATRGIDSGLTGRTEMWAFFLSLFAERPLLGYGFDMSRFYAANYVSDGLGSAHNSYITLLFDFGIVGFSIYFMLVVLALIGALRSRTLLPLAFISIYLLIGLTESRPLNVGNPSGIFFAIFIPYLAGQAFRQPFQTRVTRKSLPHLGYS